MLEQIDPRPENPAMSRHYALPLALLLIAVPVTASAQTGAPDTENGRYSFSRVEDGYLRLDQRTGQVSVCSRRVRRLVLPSGPGRAGGARGGDRASAARQCVAEEGDAGAGNHAAGRMRPRRPPSPTEKPILKVPSDAELDRAVAVMERFWKRLVDMVQRWQREMTPI